ncbi:MAG: S9 family peptidase, partial [Bacillota bacterium]
MTTCALAQQPSQKLQYPPTRKVDQIDDYHGTKIADPYRWLEDANSEETHQWVEAQNKVTFEYLGSIAVRDAIRRRLSALWSYERFSIPFKEGSRYFYQRNPGLLNQSILYVAESLDGEPRVLLDPNTLSKDGTVALQSLAVSEDGKYLAYALSAAGSDWQEWHVRDVSTGTDLPDHLKWTKWTGASWTHDHKGFFYTRLPEPPPGAELQAANFNQELR